MADAFLGEIRIMAFGFTPRGWAQCDGSLIPVAQNQSLSSLLGKRFGGNGVTTFALPDMRGRAGMHVGKPVSRFGAVMSEVALAEQGGLEAVTLTPSEVPAHTHDLFAAKKEGNANLPVNALPAAKSRTGLSMFTSAPPFASAAPVSLHPDAMSKGGGDQPHENMQPFLTVNFCIAMVGSFPLRG